MAGKAKPSLMGYVPYSRLFPEQGAAETRVAFVLKHDVLPGDEYGLYELYCRDPDCDCRRVLINVFGRRQQERGILATIGYCFNRDDEFAGPYLDTLNPQTEYSDALLELVEQVLQDPAYVARLERHYRQVKAAGRRPPASPAAVNGWRNQPRRQRAKLARRR